MSWSQADLDAVLARARKHLEGNGLQLSGEIKLRRTEQLPDLWRLGIAARTTRRLSSTSPEIPFAIADIDKLVRGRFGIGLVEKLAEQAPLHDRTAAKTSATAAKAAVNEEVALLLDRHPVRTDALIAAMDARHVTSGEGVRAAQVLALLPTDGLSMTTLAERATGDSKALGNTAIRRLVLKVLAAEADIVAPGGADERNALWASYGVVVDTLSSTVLTLGLRSDTDNPLGQQLNVFADAGEPCVLTLSQLTRWPLAIAKDDVFVCENPAVVLAASSTGIRAPLMCTQGVPSVAAHRLLANITATIHWRGDFDWTGLRTTAAAIERYNVHPWRMDASTYRTALKRGESERFKRDTPAPSPWDPELAKAMVQNRRAVMEERIIGELLKDLH